MFLFAGSFLWGIERVFNGLVGSDVEWLTLFTKSNRICLNKKGSGVLERERLR